VQYTDVVVSQCEEWISSGLGLDIMAGTVIMAGKLTLWDRGSTAVKVLCYKSEGRWFDPS